MRWPWKTAWAAVGGYDHVRFGWEDYDFWCRLAEHGHYGRQVDDILAEYHVHGGLMLRTSTDIPTHKQQLVADTVRRHPWITVDQVLATNLPSRGRTPTGKNRHRRNT